MEVKIKNNKIDILYLAPIIKNVEAYQYFEAPAMDLSDVASLSLPH